MPVECSNYGAIGPEFWLSLAALLLAGVAGWYAKRSADAADAAVGLAREEVKMARAEHEEFMRQLRARARFRLALRTTPAPDDDGVIRENATVVNVRIEVILKNEGERAAGDTVVNVVAPRHVGLRWCGPRGEQLADATPAAETPEELADADGRTWSGEYLKLTFPSVTRRAAYSRFAALSVEVPREGVRSVPLKVTAQADELPDDVDEEVECLMIRVALRQP
jgi:hypothetical protein